MIWILLVVLPVISCELSEPSAIRVCVPQSLSTPCADMEKAVGETFSCILAPDTYGCLEKVQVGEADITNVDPYGVYLAGKAFDLQPIFSEYVNGNPFRYQAVAVVRKEDSSIQRAEDLRHRASCHTGVGKSAGWKIPIARLVSGEVMAPDCEEGELAAAHNFFNGSCAPGLWSKDPLVDRELKNMYPGLCKRCKDPSTCNSSDIYAGYDGALKCLWEGAGDVAFTKLPALREYVEKKPQFEEVAEILCFEGGRKSLADPEPCFWGHRLTNAYVSRPVSEQRVAEIEEAFESVGRLYSDESPPEWYHKVILSHSEASRLVPTIGEGRSNYRSYLGDFMRAIEKGCGEEAEASFCLTSDAEAAMCGRYSRAAASLGLWPAVGCVRGHSKAACMEVLKGGHAQMLVLDGGDAYKAGRYHGLQPIASELYNGSDATYYAVAVVRSESDFNKLSDLRGLRSCHTGMGRTAGWVMPVGAMLSQGLLDDDGRCNRAAAVADFFSSGSCVPGANDSKSNPGRIRNEDLCKRCIGDDRGENKCSRDSKERFSGYAGAFRCLASGHGEVAFVKHSTAREHTDGRGAAAWDKDLVSGDFELLCGGSGGRDSLRNYGRCNLGKVPSHQVVTSGGLPRSRRLHLARLLADTSALFSNQSSYFRLFRRGDEPDALFKDSATGLKITPSEENYELVLGETFLEASKAADPKNCVR